MDPLTYVIWGMTTIRPLRKIYKTRYFGLHLISKSVTGKNVDQVWEWIARRELGI